MYGEGVSKEGGLLDVGVAMDVVTKTGAWFNFGETRLGQGREASKDFLKANPEIAAEIERAHPRQDQRDRRSRSRASRRRSSAAWSTLASVAARIARDAFAERRARRAAVDDPAVVLEAAARFLEARSRSVDEVRRRLASAGYRPELIDGAIDRLTELGMLDDEAFARQWVESRDRARPRGERALRDELRRKGIERDDDRRHPRGASRRVAGSRRSTTDAAKRPEPGPRRRRAADRRKHARPLAGSPTPASVASGPTRCWPGTASTRDLPRGRRRSRSGAGRGGDGRRRGAGAGRGRGSVEPRDQRLCVPRDAGEVRRAHVARQSIPMKLRPGTSVRPPS